MSESISDVILRLARRYLPVDAAAPIAPAQPASEPAELPIDAPTPSPREQDNASISERDRETGLEPRPAADSPGTEPVAHSSNPYTIAADPSRSESLEIAGKRSDEDNQEVAQR